MTTPPAAPTQSALPDRASFTFVVHRLTYPELWRLANHSWFGFLLLVHLKLTKSPRLDRIDTYTYAATLLLDAEIPLHAQDRLRSAQVQYAELGFRYLGIDDEILRVKGCVAYFARGPVIGIQVILPKHNFTMLQSFPPGSLPFVSANGRGIIDNSALYETLLVPKLRIAELFERHSARIAALALPDLSDAEVLAHLEQVARDARALQVARGVFVPHPLVPPLLPKDYGAK